MSELGRVKDQIRVDCNTGKSTQISKLNVLQGDLKELTAENYLKLKNQILKTGFAFAIHCWADKNGKLWIVDGTQRLITLRKMHEEGYKIPNIPIVQVKAANLKEAKRRVLQGASQYGEVTVDGLKRFMDENKFSIDEIKLSFDFPEINLEKFEEGFFGDGSISQKEVAGSTEISEGEFSHLVHTCPSCGHRFAREA